MPTWVELDSGDFIQLDHVFEVHVNALTLNASYGKTPITANDLGKIKGALGLVAAVPPPPPEGTVSEDGTKDWRGGHWVPIPASLTKLPPEETVSADGATVLRDGKWVPNTPTEVPAPAVVDPAPFTPTPYQGESLPSADPNYVPHGSHKRHK